MRQLTHCLLVGVLCLGVAGLSMATEKGQKARNGLSGMSKEEQIKVALSAAPPHVAKDAGVKLPDPLGAWIMFDGTPYAHLMIYQDPSKMTK